MTTSGLLPVGFLTTGKCGFEPGQTPMILFLMANPKRPIPISPKLAGSGVAVVNSTAPEYGAQAVSCRNRTTPAAPLSELENIVEHSVVMNASGALLDGADFALPRTAQPERISAIAFPTGLPEKGMDLSATLRQFERAMLDQALTKARGNKTLAAELLRLPRTTLIHKLHAFGQAA
jgi:Bacterial regulatory protein, Fis family